MKSKINLIQIYLLGAALLSALTALATVRNVTSLNDSGAGTLRQSILDSAANDTIQLTVSGTITLTSGELFIDRSLTIIGPVATNLTISGNQSNRVFHISATGNLNLFGLTLANGSVTGATGTGGVAGGDGLGGGVFDEGIASLTDCVITNCSATGGQGGGAKSSQGANGGDGGGGGIYNDNQLSLLRCTLSGNSSQGGTGGTGGRSGDDGLAGGAGGEAFGGGLVNGGFVTLTNCTLVENLASGGLGGTGGKAILTGTNGPGGAGGDAEGAGLLFGSGSMSVSLMSCTISSNLSVAGSGGPGGGAHGSGGSLGAGVGDGGGFVALKNVQVRNCIISGNQADYALDVNGTVVSGGFNLVGISDGSFGWLVGESNTVGNSFFPINPRLGPLQNNGGPTPTMALLSSSPAIDQGNSFGLTTDQRGFVRPSDEGSVVNASGGDGSDIGAYEVAIIVAAPALLSSSGYGNNHFQFLITGLVGWNYVVQTSTNLASPNWTAIVTNVSPFTFVESNVNSYPRRFYRAVSVP